MLIEPIAVAFANTRSSSDRDRIATLAAWRAWLGSWPGLRVAGHAVDAPGLLALRTIRDDVQLILRGAAGRGGRQRAPEARLLELARAPSMLALRWRAGRPALALARSAAAAGAMGQHLAHSAIDLLVSGPPLAVCRGRACLKLFVASRPDRRWCDSAVCGNRARVRAHGRREHALRQKTGGASD
jgi:predicted RNA-binding Zn ribbon-like protein